MRAFKTTGKLPSKIGPKAGPKGTQVIAPAENIGKVSGKIIFDLDRGYISEVKLRKVNRGFNESQYVEVSLSRVPGKYDGHHARTHATPHFGQGESPTGSQPKPKHSSSEGLRRSGDRHCRWNVSVHPENRSGKPLGGR